MKTIKWIMLTLITLYLTATISSCGILQNLYEAQQNYLNPSHSLITNNDFEVVWNISDISISPSDRRPNIVGGVEKIVVEGLQKGSAVRGNIFGLDSTTGDIIWQIPGTGSGYGEKLIQDNILYRGTAGVATIQSYDLEKGNLIWQTDLPSAHSVTDIYFSESKIFTYTSDDEFYILSNRGEILDSSHVTSRMFLMMDGLLYKDNVYSIRAIDITTNKELWGVEIGEHYTYAPVFDNGTIFLRTSSNPATIYSINQSTGKVNWTLSINILSNLYVTNDKIYCISSDSYLVTVDRQTGTEVSKVEITPSFNLNEQAGDYSVTGDPANNMLVISFGDNTQIMGLKIMNP